MIAPFILAPVNRHDATLLPESIRSLCIFAEELHLSIKGSRITFDSGFDGKGSRQVIKEAGLIPVIHPNRRNTKIPILIARMYRWFDRITYELRFRVERVFAWADVYRRLVVCYERLTSTHRGFRYLAYAVMNLRNSL